MTKEIAGIEDFFRTVKLLFLTIGFRLFFSLCFLNICLPILAGTHGNLAPDLIKLLTLTTRIYQ